MEGDRYTMSWSSDGKTLPYLAVFTYDNKEARKNQLKAAKETGDPAIQFKYGKMRHKYVHTVPMSIEEVDEDRKAIVMKAFDTIQSVQEDIIRSMIANKAFEKGIKISDAAVKEHLATIHVKHVRVMRIDNPEEFGEFVTAGPVDWYLDKDSSVTGGIAVTNNTLRYMIPGCTQAGTLWQTTSITNT